MIKKVAILQSNYIPWKGYFDIIAEVDEFIIYDDVQYTKNDWRNRNIIKTKNGLQWLTIPVKHLNLSQKIKDTTIVNSDWRYKHFETIKQAYSKAKYYSEYKDFFEELYDSCTFSNLSKINYHFLTAISKLVGLNTKFSWSGDYDLIEGKTERLVDLVKKAGGDEYLSGPAAKNYLNTELFEKEGIKVTWFDYSNYKEYDQLYPPFEHSVSIIDLIFNTGIEIKEYMKFSC